MTDEDDKRIYAVVANDEGQHSLWPVEREPPTGWSRVGVEGSKVDCMAYVDESWTDMRPLSLQRRMSKGTPTG